MITLEELENEGLSLGKIMIEEFQENPNIIVERLDAKIKELLVKYGCAFALTEFQWVNGQVSANFSVVKKQDG